MTAPSDKSPKNAKEKQKIYTAIRYCSLHMVENGILPSIFSHKATQGPQFQAKELSAYNTCIRFWMESKFHSLELEKEFGGHRIESSYSERFLTTANQNPRTSETS